MTEQFKRWVMGRMPVKTPDWQVNLMWEAWVAALSYAQPAPMAWTREEPTREGAYITASEKQEWGSNFRVLFLKMDGGQLKDQFGNPLNKAVDLWVGPLPVEKLEGGEAAMFMARGKLLQAPAAGWDTYYRAQQLLISIKARLGYVTEYVYSGTLHPSNLERINDFLLSESKMGEVIQNVAYTEEVKKKAEYLIQQVSGMRERGSSISPLVADAEILAQAIIDKPTAENK